METMTDNVSRNALASNPGCGIPTNDGATTAMPSNFLTGHHANTFNHDMNKNFISPDRFTSSRDSDTITSSRDSDNTNCEQMNISYGESTGVVLTKALKTLVCCDYEMITPPRKCKHQKETNQKDKKFSLFRPYDLDNEKCNGKKHSVPTQSPMLLRSNYSNSGQEWLIEKHSKSEAIVNRVKYLGCQHEQVPETVIPEVNATLVAHETGETNKSTTPSTDETTVQENVSCQISVNKDMRMISPVLSTHRLSMVSMTLPRPIRSSTPKTSPCPSPHVIHVMPSAETNGYSRDVATTAVLTPDRSYYSISSTVQLPSDSSSAALPRFQDHTSSQTAGYTPMQQSSKNDVIATQPEVPAHIRYHAQVGHRLPLKHSYKHQFVAADPPVERSRTPLKQEPIKETCANDRYRSNSCPPITKYQDLACTNTKSFTTQSQVALVSSHEQNGIMSSATKSYIDAVKETWAMHHAVMTSTMSMTKHGNDVLPSFSTFTNKLLSTSQDKATSVPSLSGRTEHMPGNTTHANQKHIRSRSVGILQVSEPLCHQVSNIPPTDQIRRKDSNKSQLLDHPVPVSCYRNVNCAAIAKPTDNVNMHATKARTWHVPIDHRMQSPAPGVDNSSSSQSETNEKDKCVDVSHKLISSHSSSISPAMYTDMHSQQVLHHSSQYVRPFAEHYAKEPMQKPSCVSSSSAAVPDVKQFNPAIDIYKDSMPFTYPLLDPKLRMFLPPHSFSPRLVARPGLMHPMYMPRYSTAKPMASTQDNFNPGSGSLRSTFRQHTHIGSLVRNHSEERSSGVDAQQKEPLIPTVVDHRRPLSTSALQNQPPMTPETKVPLGALMMMIKVLYLFIHLFFI